MIEYSGKDGKHRVTANGVTRECRTVEEAMAYVEELRKERSEHEE